MAGVRANVKDGKVVSYRFTVCLGRDERDRQIRKYTTWTPPKGMSPAKAKKLATREADLWEQKMIGDQIRGKTDLSYRETEISPEERRDDFLSFVNDVWLPLEIRDGNGKPTTIS